MTFTPLPTQNGWTAQIKCDKPGCKTVAEFEYPDTETMMSKSPSDLAEAGWQSGVDIPITEHRAVYGEEGNVIEAGDGRVQTEAHERGMRGDMCPGCRDG